MISHEDAFIDRAFELGSVEGLRPENIKKYIRYIADIRLTQLNLQPILHHQLLLQKEPLQIFWTLSYFLINKF